ncbi:MAG TPA: DUF4254 domain-containing protein [Acidobacteriaceae bacterium]|nr:DUF4254 domain-containing protein [Acidobacteriaceae bacterium]
MILPMGSARFINAMQIVRLFDEWTARWHQSPPPQKLSGDIHAAVEQLHRANFELWHQEDKARDVQSGDTAIAAAKRAIDLINQRRNDHIERCDEILLQELAAEALSNPQAELHSETPGMMLDRLSIMSLKVYHTREETERIPSPPGHRERNLRRLAILETQRMDLAACLDRLWQRVLGGQLRFQVYRQLKMYNDPDLNPVLYDK